MPPSRLRSSVWWVSHLERMAFSAVKHSSHLSIAPSNRAVPRARGVAVGAPWRSPGWSGDWFSVLRDFRVRLPYRRERAAIDVVRGPQRWIKQFAKRHEGNRVFDF